ncbi:hypothetical protein B0I31_104223 [Saccharothrix carnea]|uniref:Tetratricopeptide repeat protein n=1 Tax=Saccharothrix carnea TaxID=1280637 RepID=A0A2P8IBT8_SACCR|nr:hypothetical protein [Saccharothrix carnea]PSL55932.1 hypothetical protein B0I31_104223 [Saccharothrix carnea]
MDHYRQALTLFQGLGDEVGVVGTLDHLADPCAALGRHDEARDAWHEALRLYRRQGRDADAERVQSRLDALP